jgi:predicted amidohydrolase
MRDTRTVTIAAAQYGVEFIATWANYAAKLEGMVSEAVAGGAQLLLFPEYACMELAALFPPEIYQDTSRQLVALQTLHDDFLELHCTLAADYGCYLVAASFPVRLTDGSYRNRAYFCRPDGTWDFQDKLIMTRFEAEVWSIAPGDTIKVFWTPFGRVGINICYDSEFPHIAHSQVANGADLILVPSCTDTMAGYHRVRTGSRARALENQCYVVTAPVVGTVDWSDAIDVNLGAAGVFTPIDRGFPDDGILTEGALHRPQWLFTTLDLAELERIRREGQVYNYRDWAYQFGHAIDVEPAPNWLLPALMTGVIHTARQERAEEAMPPRDHLLARRK